MKNVHKTNVNGLLIAETQSIC